ncbi:MAG: SUMF1/EgtB/PvdO family nonheme iron enzyme [Proteobacteria bacterium]|nr:SUMF1/EgtB/PvdO family nonheme iron enzyme [Pseudomonadota bacterium]
MRIPTAAESAYALRYVNKTLCPWRFAGNRGCAFDNIAEINFKRFRPSIQSTAACDDRHTFTAPVGCYGTGAVGTVDLSGNV